MPRRATPLTARQVSTRGPGVYGDGNGLYLVVTSAGRSWELRYQIGGKRRSMGLGGVNKVTLAKARELTRELQAKIADGIDPLEERRQSRKEAAPVPTDLPTFRQCAEACLIKVRDECRSAAHVKEWEQSLVRHVYPKIGELPVRDITITHIIDILTPIWTQIPETASRVRNRIETVLTHAAASGYRPEDEINPAIWGGRLKVLFGKVSVLKKRKRLKLGTEENYRSLPYTETPQFVSWLQTQSQASIAAPVLEFIILTGSRLFPARSAEWSEVDWDNKIWTVPGSKMKSGEKFRVALSNRAIDLLRQQQANNLLNSDHVFPGDHPSRPAGDETVRGFLVRNGYRGVLTTHGFRSTLRDWMATQKTRFSWGACEAMLAHALPKVAGIYQRDDLLDERREIVEAWADYLYSTGTVISIKRAAG